MSLIDKIKNIGGTKTVLFYADQDYPFTINFEGKTFNSKLISNTQWIILDIPYNARISFDVIAERAAKIILNDSGRSLEEYLEDNNLLVYIQNIIGEPQE